MEIELKEGDKVKMSYHKWTPNFIEKHFMNGTVLDFNNGGKDTPLVEWDLNEDTGGYKQVCKSEWLTKI